MNDLIERLIEAGRKKSLPESQQKFYDYVVGIDPSNANPDMIVKDEAFFWILSDGSTVFSGSGGGLHHADGARSAGTSMSKMMKTGALRGTFFDAVGIEVDIEASINTVQVESVQYLVQKSDMSLIIDVFDGSPTAKEANAAWYYIDRAVSNEVLYEILNGRGEVKKFRKTMQEIMKIDQKLGERIIQR